jgi:hypothetical protein
MVQSEFNLGFWFVSYNFLSLAVFSSLKILKILQDSPSHRIFGRMHGVLNVGKKITNYTVCL